MVEMIRDAAPADVPAITDIYNEAIREGGLTGQLEPLSLDDRRAWFSVHRGRYAVVVKIVDGAVLGYSALSPYRGGRGAFDETCEISYFLANRARGRGFGRELITHAMDRAGGSGFRLMVAIALDCNRRSVAILHKYGFVESGRIPGAARISGVYVDHLYLSRPVAI
jgi:L-amino acid N-acyltransferase YncA